MPPANSILTGAKGFRIKDLYQTLEGTCAITWMWSEKDNGYSGDAPKVAFLYTLTPLDECRCHTDSSEESHRQSQSIHTVG